MKKKREIKFVCYAVRWFDRINGNTYHSVRVERVKDGKILYSDRMIYGYGDHYHYTALKLMAENKWLPVKYRKDDIQDNNSFYYYERENNYPIHWNVKDGLKRDMYRNVSY